MNSQGLFLLAASVGLTPIALSYGLMPHYSLSFLFGIDAQAVNVAHIFRAIMGLYLALALFWVVGALNQQITLPALYSLVVFMLGLALGRSLSIVVDGMPHWLLVVYLVLEVGFGLVGVYMIRVHRSGD